MGKKINIEEQVLVKMLSGRNARAIEVLYDYYASAMYGIIKRIIPDDGIAEKVLSESFLKVWNNFNSYNSAKGRLFTWIINICRELSIEKMRSSDLNFKNKKQSSEKFVSADNSAINSSYDPDSIGIEEVEKQLEPEYRIIIDLLFFENYSQSEVAEKLNIPLGTVKTRSRAAVQKLRMLFENDINTE